MKEHQPLSNPWLDANYDGDGVQSTSAIGSDGKEYPDPIPMAPPVGYSAPPTIMEMIKSMIHSERLLAQADSEGFDTYDEAEDFDIPDDPMDPHTDYEAVFDPPPKPLPDPVPTSTVNPAGTPAAGGSPNSPPAPASAQTQKLLDTSSLGDTSPTQNQNQNPQLATSQQKDGRA
ncbi:hypothetical protein [robinz microvirus RP_147]|nr:hypothetical protein [robinz microvirus RP_147]